LGSAKNLNLRTHVGEYSVMGLDSESDLYSGPGIIRCNICYLTIRSLVYLSVKW